MKDESHLPYEEQSLLFRLKKRAEIRRAIPRAKEGERDKISDLLEEAFDKIEELEGEVASLMAGDDI